MEFILISAGDLGWVYRNMRKRVMKTLCSIRYSISRGFYIGKYEVTQAQWVKVMINNPSQFQDCGEDCPVENINWYEIQEFIRRLNQLNVNDRKDRYRFRMPTEAEWDYVCRAGTRMAFSLSG